MKIFLISTFFIFLDMFAIAGEHTIKCHDRIDIAKEFLIQNHPECYSFKWMTCAVHNEPPGHDGVKMSFMEKVWDPYEGETYLTEGRIILFINRETYQVAIDNALSQLNCEYNGPENGN